MLAALRGNTTTRPVDANAQYNQVQILTATFGEDLLEKRYLDAKGYRAPYLPGFGIKADYGYCGDDTTHVFHYSGTYQLPVGDGKRFAGSATGALNQVIGGWSVNWITTLESGLPFTIGCPAGATTGDFGCNALLVPGQNIYAGPHNINDFLNAEILCHR